MKTILDAFDFEINLDGVDWEHNLEDAIGIDRTNLDREFELQPSRYYFYSYLSELAKDLVARSKRELDNLEAHLDREKRDELRGLQVGNPKFKFTEKMVSTWL